MSATPSKAMLMRFEPADTAKKISRKTLARLTKHLGYKHESDVLHYAVRKLANEVLPAYEADNGPLTDKEVTAIRKAAGPARDGKVISSLF